METYCKRLSEELSKIATVEIIALPGRTDGMVKTGLPLVVFGLKTAIKLLLREPYPVTHFSDMAIWPLALFARLRSRKTRLVISAHGTDVSYPPRGGFKGKVYGWYLALGSKLLPSLRVIANSNATASTTQLYGYKDLKIVPLGTDRVERGDLGTDFAPHHLLFAGRIVDGKGLSWFVQNVLSELPEAMRLRVAGTVWDNEEAAALDDPRVDYLGSLSFPDLQKEYAAALCVAMPNISSKNKTFEGFGLTAIEAAATGGVVLAADHGGLKQAVVHDTSGFLLPSGNAEAWVKKIQAVASWKPNERKAFTAKSVSTIDSYYSWQRVARDTQKAYFDCEEPEAK